MDASERPSRAFVRRRNQPELGRLPLQARFLNHVAAVRGLTQSGLAARLDAASESTVSRWFRGTSLPQERDYERLSGVLDVPLNNFRALRVLDSLENASMQASTGAWRYMVDTDSAQLLMVGVTMLAGVFEVRDADLSSTAVTLSIADPSPEGDRESSLARLELEVDGFESFVARANWLACYTLLRLIARRGARVRLWVRPEPAVVVPGSENAFAGQLVANDWIAISSGHPQQGVPYSVSFFGDPDWSVTAGPLREALSQQDEVPSHTLVWDSDWSDSDPRRATMRARLDRVLAALSAESLSP